MLIACSQVTAIRDGILVAATVFFFIMTGKCQKNWDANQGLVLDRMNSVWEDEHSVTLKHVFFRDAAAPLRILHVPQRTTALNGQFGVAEFMVPLEIRSERMPLQIYGTSQSGKLFLESKHSKDEDWRITEVMGPNITDKTTVINLAKMTSDAYNIDPSQPDWYNISLGFNHSKGFGWDEDGLRGHVFADDKNETVIIAFKGTSIDPRDKWSVNDRLNDNTLFSCCCATQRSDPYWYGKACDCRTDTYKCNSACLTKELMREDHYYATAFQVYLNVTRIYPRAQVWMTGHSMGGAMASLIGLMFNVPAVTFESLPQRLPAQRLGLPVAPNPRLTGAFHFGHSADPVYMGACNGFFSACSVGGFAFESQCFTGHRCEYDTVGDFGWRMSINTHRINNVIPNVLEAYDTVANCSLDLECAECDNWYFDWDPKDSKIAIP